MQKHLRRLGLYTGEDYLRWCMRRGFEASYRKTWDALEEEWSAHGREIARAQSRLKVDRDPAKLIARVCEGKLRPRDIARPRWRALAERIDAQPMTARQTRALRRLVEVVAKRGRLLLAEGEVGGDRLPYLDALVALAQNHRHWVRKPVDWHPRTHNAERQLASLIRHLMARYPVPAFMDAAWLRSGETALAYRRWYRAIGRGENLRHQEGPIPWTNRIVHWFLKAPAHLSIEAAIRWGQVRAEGGNEALARAIVASRIGRNFEHDAFWVTVIRFFVLHDWILPRAVGPIIDYLHHQRFVVVEAFEAPGVRAPARPAQPNLTMRGRSPFALLREVERWHRDLARTPTRGPISWPGSGIREFSQETGIKGRTLQVWLIRELRSAAALHAEGARMRHCVATYVPFCRDGDCSIWTMERHSFEGIDPRVTIEVNREGEIVEVRGKANRDPSERELDVIRSWAVRERLQLAPFIG